MVQIVKSLTAKCPGSALRLVLLSFTNSSCEWFWLFSQSLLIRLFLLLVLLFIHLAVKTACLRTCPPGSDHACLWTRHCKSPHSLCLWILDLLSDLDLIYFERKDLRFAVTIKDVFLDLNLNMKTLFAFGLSLTILKLFLNTCASLIYLYSLSVCLFSVNRPRSSSCSGFCNAIFNYPPLIISLYSPVVSVYLYWSDLPPSQLLFLTSLPAPAASFILSFL